MSKPVYVGLDIGSSRTKVAVVDAERRLLGHAVRKSGTDFSVTAAACLDMSLSMAGARRHEIAGAVSTGYAAPTSPSSPGGAGPRSAASPGMPQPVPEAITVIDIGGQDNKIIMVESDGRRSGFRMNRKCAAGTGPSWRRCPPGSTSPR